MAEIRRKAGAVWQGSLQEGKGSLSTNSGALQETPYSFAMRFKDQPGTNPEELIAAAHAGCFNMALSSALGEKGYTPTRLETAATCYLSPQESGFGITKMHLAIRAQVDGLDEQAFAQIVAEADKGCPVSNLLREGLTIEVDATLV